MKIRIQKVPPRSPRLDGKKFWGFRSDLKRWQGKGLACQSKRLYHGATKQPAGDGGRKQHCLHRLTDPRAGWVPAGHVTCTHLWTKAAYGRGIRAGQHLCVIPDQGVQEVGANINVANKLCLTFQLPPIVAAMKPSPNSPETSPVKLEGPRGEEEKTTAKAKNAWPHWAEVMGPLRKQFKGLGKYFCVHGINQMYTD